MIDQRNRDLNAVVDVTESAIRNDNVNLQWYGYDPQAPLPTDDGIFEYLFGQCRHQNAGLELRLRMKLPLLNGQRQPLPCSPIWPLLRFRVLDKREALLADPDRCSAISFRARSRILSLSQPQSSVQRYFHYASQETVSVCQTFTEFGRGRAVFVEETLGMSGNFKYKS